MALFHLEPYQPVNCLKPFAEEVWIVDGPVIEMRYPWLPFFSIPFQTRMTVVRLEDGGLWLHSPTHLTNSLRNELQALGPIRYFIAPNKLHYWWLQDWQKAYPGVLTYVSPGVPEYAKGKREFRVDGILGETPRPAWHGQIDQVQVAGDFMVETDFFHRKSRTLILTDLIENFEPSKVRNRFARWILRTSGASDPDGSLPLDLRASFKNETDWVRKAVEEMLGWNPERIILAHGRPYTENGSAELRRAFRWLGELDAREEEQASGSEH